MMTDITPDMILMWWFYHHIFCRFSCGQIRKLSESELYWRVERKTE
ncbi:hypothetical protein CSO39_002821 [Salmonella enterica subsp. arizonae]|nr:hypothetical protein [Salmonella enterica subsp. arizonae]